MSDEPQDDALEALLVDAFALRGEVLPTTEAEVRAAEREVESADAELPPSLAALGDTFEEGEVSPEVLRAAASVASLGGRRRARDERRASFWTHGGAFLLGGAAAAAAALLILHDPRGEAILRDPERSASLAPSASSAPSPRIVIPAVRSCGDACCAGSSCASAEGELRACGSGRLCVPCGDAPDPGSVYRLRLGNLQPTRALDQMGVAELDLCARVGGSPWSCEPAFEGAAARPEGRALPLLSSAADIAAGIELELRPHGNARIVGAWRESVRLGPKALCRGIGALIANEKEQPMGSVSLTLDDAHYVELARAAGVGPLRERAATLDLTDVTLRVVETKQTGGEHFALMVGPLDHAAAERLRWELLDRSQAARAVLGDDYAGASRPLP